MSLNAPVTIRNLTSCTIELISIGHFTNSFVAGVEDAVLDVAKGRRRYTTSTKSASKAQQPTTHQKVIHSENVSFVIEPFQATKTDKVLAGSSGQLDRLTFRTGKDEHHLDVHVGKFECKDLVPGASETTSKLTGIHIPASSHITIFSSANLSSWMSRLKDDTALSGISIPGTHNAPAYHHALPSVRCQAVSPRLQLDNGVRFFDIRARVLDSAKDDLELVHAVFPVSLTGRKSFRGLIDDIFAFLAQNPTETVLMTVKREGLGKGTDEQLANVLQNHFTGDLTKWFTAPRIPYLGEVRGKIILIRRFNIDDSLRGEYGGAGWCLDASTWADNTPDALCPSGDIRVQDFYQVMWTPTIATKTQYVEAHMVRSSTIVTALPATATASPAAAIVGSGIGPVAAQPPEKQPIFMNFLSASNFFNPACWPERVAAKLNPAIVEYLCMRHNRSKEDGQLAAGDGCTGVVVCDWVGHKGNWDLVRAIVGWNAKLECREKGSTV